MYFRKPKKGCAFTPSGTGGEINSFVVPFLKNLILRDFVSQFSVLEDRNLYLSYKIEC